MERRSPNRLLQTRLQAKRYFSYVLDGPILMWNNSLVRILGCWIALLLANGGWLNLAHAAKPIRILFLGDQGHHRPLEFAGRLIPALQKFDIVVEYTEDQTILHPDRLKEFDGILIYANIDTITQDQETALLEFVESGKGFIPVHCATYCFRNSDAYIALCGAQFKSHGGEEFETVNVAPEHPIMKGFGGFRSWDETYLHHRHNPQQRTVLEVRKQGDLAEGTTEEPWTWVRTQGKGRVFYTAWGHDVRTWKQNGFHNLLARGIHWACGRDPSLLPEFKESDSFDVPKMTPFRTDVQPFTYTEVGSKIPNYTPSKKWGVQGDPLTKMQNPLPAEESIKHYITPEGFEPRLWASEPKLAGKPIAMTWDDRGRLWVCETVDYPNELQPPGSGRDRIRICEDRDGDGQADHFTVFAEKMSIPTTLVWYRDGIIVQDGPKTVYLKDIDGDDQADFRQELITGWGITDTHGGVSNFQYGLDNWIWAMQGYNDSTPVINGVPQSTFRQGFWRFRVEPGKADATAPVTPIGKKSLNEQDLARHTIRVQEVEYVRATNNNTWGLGISEEGLIFGSTANGNPSNFMPIPNRYYESVRGWSPSTLEMISDSAKFNTATDKVRQVDWHGGYTAAAGHSLYTARQFPKTWWNRLAFVCEPTGHIVGAFVLRPDGSNYKSRNSFNLLASRDEWASPIMAEVGPDGTMWVIDWYNFIVQHNPTPHGFETGRGNAYESDLRDKIHGRIYRIVYTGNEEPLSTEAKKAVEIFQRGLHTAKPLEWVQTLQHPTMRCRLLAQQHLVGEKTLAPETVKALLALTANPSVDAIGLNVAAIHALWVLQAHQLVQPDKTEIWSAVTKAMKHPSRGVRRAAVQILPKHASTLTALTDGHILDDQDPQVLLAALLKIADSPATSPAEAAIAAALAKTNWLGLEDRWISDAWSMAVAPRTAAVFGLLVANDDSTSAAMRDRIAIVAEHWARSKPDAKQVNQLMLGLSKWNNPAIEACLAGIARGWPNDHQVQIDRPADEACFAILVKVGVASKSQLVQWGNAIGAKSMAEQVAKISEQLAELVGDEQASPKDRIDAAKQWMSIDAKNSTVIEKVLERITPQTPSEVAKGLIANMTQSKSDRLGALLIDAISRFTPEIRDATMRVLLARPETTETLLAAIREGKLSLSDLTLDQKQALRDHPNPQIKKLATDLMASGGGVPSANRAKVLEDWLPVAQTKGDVERGKAMYKKHCAVCHRHQGEGQNIGPDLSGMAAHPKSELLTNILDPNRSVEGNFRTYMVVTSDGLVLTGMLAGESRTSIDLINAEGKKESILREDIEKLTASSKSLMPEGFEGQMNRDEMADLLEFLANKGQYIPLPLNGIATAVSTKGLFSDDDLGPDRLIFKDWSPKTFEGVPFVLIDPIDKRVPNIVLLNGPLGPLPPKMPKSVRIPCAIPTKAVHLLSGISGWGFPYHPEKSVSMTVRFHFADGSTEDHPLLNGEHFADYIRKVEVPGSKFAFSLGGQQVRYLKIECQQDKEMKEIELLKGNDITAPVIMAATVEPR